jgi:ferrous iron transport protein B
MRVFGFLRAHIHMERRTDNDGGAGEPLIAVAGNPNTGKSTLFNRLTGLRQRVGNYPGVTVERKSGVMQAEGRALEMVDLPGTYSLCASSPDEAVVIETLLGIGQDRRPDLIMCVVDSTALVRSLFIAAQMADLGLPMVIALNMWDEAMEKGVAFDHVELSHRLGVPCIPVSAKTGAGVDELKEAVVSALAKRPKMNKPQWPAPVGRAVEVLRHELGNPDYEAPVLRRILLDSAGALAQRIGIDEELRRHALAVARKTLFDHGLNPSACEAMLHYRNLRDWTAGVSEDTCVRTGGRTESIDRLMMHRGWGMVVFVCVMYLVFQAVYSWATPFMDLIDQVVHMAQGWVGDALAGSPTLRSLLADGIIGGLGACIMFLPQILILFMFIALLEDSGYLPRVAFLMDKPFSWCGLGGNSFVPLLSCHACAVPGIMATRTIKDPKTRLATILVAPLMSCSARLPVYALFIGMFIQPRHGSFVAGVVLLGMHLVGLALAAPTAFLFTRLILRVRSTPFLMELPPYRVPHVKDVVVRMLERGKVFLKTAGTVIFAMTVFIWALMYFPRPDIDAEAALESFSTTYAGEAGLDVATVRSLVEAGDPVTLAAMEQHGLSLALEHSYLGMAGRFIQPIFAPAGFDWKLSVGIVSSFPAREVILSTMGVIFRTGDDPNAGGAVLQDRMRAEKWRDGPKAGQPVYTLPVVLALMVFSPSAPSVPPLSPPWGARRAGSGPCSPSPT